MEDPSSPLSPAPTGQRREVDAHAALLLQSITDGFYGLDSQWRFTFLNEVASRTLTEPGQDPSALLGANLWEAFPAICGTIAEQEFLRASNEKVTVEFEVFYPPWQRWFFNRAYPVPGGGLAVYFRDVTDEWEATSLLRSSERRYRSLFNSIDEGFCLLEIIWDAEGTAIDYRFLEVNPAFERQSGLQNAQGRTARELVPHLEEDWFEIYGKVARTGEPVRFIHGSESMCRWFDVYAFPLETELGRRVALLFTDITATRAASLEAARVGLDARERLAELETLLDVLPVGIGIATDRECRNIRVNSSFAQVLGIGVQENGSKTAPEGEQPRNFRVLDDAGQEVPGADLPMQVAAREGREVRDIELNVEHSNGRRVRLLEYAAPLFDEHGVPRGSVGAFVDITERRNIEERQKFLVALDDALRSLSSADEIVTVSTTMLGDYLNADRCAYGAIEIDQDTLTITGDSCRDVPSIVGRYTLGQFGQELRDLMRANDPYVLEDVETAELGASVLVSYRAASIRAVICVPLHKDGRLVAAMAVHQRCPRQWHDDQVTLLRHVANRCWEALERARVTRGLSESEERFRNLADNMAQLAWMTDAGGSIFWYNKRWFDYTGTTMEQMQGWGWAHVHDPAYLERVIARWKESLEQGIEWEDTFPLRGADGQYRWFLSRAVPIRNAEGKVLRWFGTNTDVTEQRAVVDALAKAKEEAEAANLAKDNFLAALSHELRTPLTPVLLSAAAMQEDETLPAEVRTQLAMMRRNIELEARLIDDLLDLTRISRGKLSLRLQDGEAHSLVGLALEIVRDEALGKGLALDVQLEAQQTHLRCDPARLQQVFWNLLNNAIKFTPSHGRITVRSRDEADRLVFEVSDTGIGLQPQVVGRIFLPFEQAGLTNDHRYGGLGLGLAITKTIVEMHGGTITAESPGPHQGATFRVELPATERTLGVLPVAEPTVQERETAPAADVRPLRLLLVEDHEPTLAVLTRLLRRAGHTVTTATTVAAAREMAAQASYDAVLSDIGLPDGTGIELMKTLSAQYGLRGIALTGYGMEDDQRRAFEAGFDAHLTKPVDFPQLRRALAQFAR